jgi:hypothetical protein
MRMAAVFINVDHYPCRPSPPHPPLAPVVGYCSSAALLLTVGIIPWLEVLFPAWVFVFSVHILVVTMRARAASPTAAA